MQPEKCIACKSVIRNRSYRFCNKHVVCPRCSRNTLVTLTENIQCSECRKWLDAVPEAVIKRLLKKHKGNKRAVRADLESRRAYSIQFVTEKGIISIDVPNSKDVSLARKYFSAVHNYLMSGNQSLLVPFRGKQLESNYFVTDPKILDMLADAGEFEFDDTDLQRHLGHGLFEPESEMNTDYEFDD
jgi:hypothetical protein